MNQEFFDSPKEVVFYKISEENNLQIIIYIYKQLFRFLYCFPLAKYESMTYFSPTCASLGIWSILYTAIFSLSYSSTESTSQNDSLKTVL